MEGLGAHRARRETAVDRSVREEGCRRPGRHRVPPQELPDLHEPPAGLAGVERCSGHIADSERAGTALPGHLFVPGADDAAEEKGKRRRPDQPERATDHDPCGDADVDTLLPLGCLEVDGNPDAELSRGPRRAVRPNAQLDTEAWRARPARVNRGTPASPASRSRGVSWLVQVAGAHCGESFHPPQGVQAMILSEGPGPSLRDDPPRRDPHRSGSPPPRSVGRLVRGARPRPLRVGPARGPATASGDRARPRLGARRGHDDAGARGGRPRDGRGQGPARGGAARRVRRRPGRGRRPRRRARARRGRLRDQGRTCRRAGRAEGRPRGASSASGSASSSRRRSASSYSTTSGCATRSAGRCSRFLGTRTVPKRSVDLPELPRLRSADRILVA